MENNNNNINDVKVTTEQFAAVQAAFDYFNKVLFNSELPQVMLNFSRHNKALGFFVPCQWFDANNADSKRHEISLNPDYLNERTLKQSYSTLVHEMCHLQQQEDGTAPRRCYHNKDFAAKMERVGLMTSSTGAAGGKRTGQKMTHYIIDGGAFDKAFDAMDKALYLPFMCHGLLSDTAKKKIQKNSSVSYVCPVCGATVRGKAGLQLACVDCEVIMQAQR